MPSDVWKFEDADLRFGVLCGTKQWTKKGSGALIRCWRWTKQRAEKRTEQTDGLGGHALNRISLDFISLRSWTAFGLQESRTQGAQQVSRVYNRSDKLT